MPLMLFAAEWGIVLTLAGKYPPLRTQSVPRLEVEALRPLPSSGKLRSASQHGRLTLVVSIEGRQLLFIVNILEDDHD